MKRISILGSGWLGLPLAIELNQLGYQIKASSRSEARLSQVKEAGISAHVYDIEADQNDVSFLQADILIINITSKNVEAYKDLIVLVENSPIQNVLFISSTSVYRDSLDPNHPAITESNQDALISCPLLTIENLFRESLHFDTSIIRFSGLIGYQRHPGRFFAQIQEDGSVKCKPIKNPEASVNMIHRDDCIGIIKALLERDIWGEVFNGCSSDHPSRREFYTHAISDYSGIENIEMNFIENENKIDKVISNEKVKIRLKYHFIVDRLLPETAVKIRLNSAD
jgi:nucleoside-diphosphate-sugar epimerase